MKYAKQVYWGFLITLSGLWCLSDSTDWAGIHGIFAWHEVLTQYTGVLAIGFM